MHPIKRVDLTSAALPTSRRILEFPSFSPLAWQLLIAWFVLYWVATCQLQADDVTAMWTGDAGSGNWLEAGDWSTPGFPNNANDRYFVVIDGNPDDVTVFLQPIEGRTIPANVAISSLDVGDGDGLNIQGVLRIHTKKTTDADPSGSITNQGTIQLGNNSRLLVEVNTDEDTTGDTVTLTGGGKIILNERFLSLSSQGSIISGAASQPRTLLVEDQTIEGAGQIGESKLRIINKDSIVANRDEMPLIIDPGSGSPKVRADYTNDGGTASATGGGILRLIAGDFNNINGGEFVAESDSTVELAFGAHINGGLLQSVGSGRFVVTGDAFLNGTNSTGLTVTTNVDVLDGNKLALQGHITNLGMTTLEAEDRLTSILIDGNVTVDGDGSILINSSVPGLALGGIAPAAPGAKLTIGNQQEVLGVGTLGSGDLTIDNQGTIAADQKGRSLSVNPSTSTDVTNSKLFEARNGGTLHLVLGWNLRGDGEIRSSFSEIFDDGPSVVLLNGVNISGQRLRTPDNPTASPLNSIDDIDPGQGVIRTRNVSTKFDLRENPPINDGLLDIADASRLTLQSKAVDKGETAPAFDNNATILLNAVAGGFAELWVSGGDVRLTGGGQIVLSDSDRNRLDQSVTEVATHTLINVDNLIVGAGNIGMRRLNLVNEPGGTILADGGNPLVIETPFDVDAFNRGVISTNAGGTLILRNAKFTNEAGARLQSLRNGTLEIEGGTLTNNGIVAAEGLDGMNANTVIERSVVVNLGIIEASEGSTIEIRNSAISGLPGQVPDVTGPVIGTIAARDTSVVELSSNTIITGGRLESSTEGRIRVVDRVGFGTPLTNDAMLAVEDGATALVIGRDFRDEVKTTRDAVNLLVNGPRGFPLNNDGTIKLNSSEVVFAGLTRLIGGGEINMSDDVGNTISGLQERPGAFPPYVLNVDNEIRGSGAIGAGLLLRNETAGEIVADGTHPLRINVPADLLTPGFVMTIVPNRFNFGLIRAEGSGGIGLEIQGGRVAPANQGTIEVAAGSSLNVTGSGGGSLLNVGRITIDSGLEPGLMSVGGLLTNGTVKDSTRLEDLPLGLKVADERGIIVIDGHFNGRILNSVGSVVRGNGILNGELVSAGKFWPGKSPGTFDITGRYEQLSGGELEIELAGMSAGEQFDQVIVDGEAVLGGTVVVKYFDGFSPDVGSEFDAVSATSLVDNGFSLAMLDGGLVRPAMVDVGDGTTVLRLTSIEGEKFTATSGSWDDAGNWTDGSPPSADDTAFLPGDPLRDTIVTGPAADAMVFSLVVGSDDEVATSATALDLDAGIISTTRGTTLRRNGRLTGNGTVDGDLYNTGTVAPGDLPGTINITGNYQQNETGKFSVVIGGTTPGAQFDQLTIDGTAVLDGILDVQLVDLGGGIFQPTFGDVFTILTANEVGGQFATVNLPPLEEGLTWTIDYLSQSVALRAGLAGDYNENGVVDAADYTVWRDNLGLEITVPGENPAAGTPGLVDQEDYAFWKSKFGQNAVSGSLEPASALASVPEPSTLISCLVFVIFLCSLRAHYLWVYASALRHD